MLFRKKKTAEPGSLLQNSWRTDFRWFEKKHFPVENTSDFSARIRQARLELKIHKPSCFAWVLGRYRYTDLIIQANVQIGRLNGHSSAGFVFRYNNEDNFYYFLISNQNRFRFDVVFNGNPIHLIEWTPFPEGADDTSELRILARDSSFSFFLADEWLAEVNDDTLKTGFVGFAAQNYEQADEGVFYLERMNIDARPLHVEQEYLRWNRYVPVDPGSRITLARTFADMGRYAETVAQLKAAVRQIPDSAEAQAELARAYTQLKAYPESLACLDRALELLPDDDQLRLQKADILFLDGDYLRCRDYVDSILDRYRQDSHLRNLAGRCEYNLGNWDKAEERYREALDLEPGSGVYRVNVARCLERQGRTEEASGHYFDAARCLFRQESYDELSLVLARLSQLVPPDAEQAGELKALEGKMLFHEGKKHQAERLFSELIEGGCLDSGVHYLYALMQIDKKQRSIAEDHLVKATELDPDYPLYWFRLAENRFLLGGDPREVLEKAYSLDADDPWINNLKAQVLIADSRYAEALPYCQKAVEFATGQADISRNCAVCLLKTDRGQEALQLLTASIEKHVGADEQLAGLYNQRGNCLVELNRCAAAVRDYEKALELMPENRDYMQNCAACCIELDMIMRAEELLNRLLEERESALLYNLTGNLAVVTGETERARLAYLEGLRLEQDNREIKLNLLSLYIESDRYQEAQNLLAEVREWENPPARCPELVKRFQQRFEEILECAGCGRQWRVPKKLPPQPAFTIRGEPPGEAPAGRCERCKRIYCIACAAEWVREGRLICPECEVPLRLKEESLKYLVLQYVDGQ